MKDIQKGENIIIKLIILIISHKVDLLNLFICVIIIVKFEENKINTNKCGTINIIDH